MIKNIDERLAKLKDELDKVSGLIETDGVVGDLLVSTPTEAQGKQLRRMFFQNIDKNGSIFGIVPKTRPKSLDEIISQISSNSQMSNLDFSCYYAIVWSESALTLQVPSYVGVELNCKIERYIGSLFELFKCSYKYLDKDSILLEVECNDICQMTHMARDIVALNVESYGWNLGGERQVMRSLNSGEIYFGLK
jgi:hypothetical protein